MRVLRMLSGLLLATLVSLLFIGCGGGGGGGDSTVDPGTAVINDSLKTITYVQGQSGAPDYVYANFVSTNPATHPTLNSAPLRPTGGGMWALDFAGDSNDFDLAPTGNYVGDYDAAVYAVFPNQTTPLQVGYRTRVTLNIVISSGDDDGIPPPPDWP